MSGSLRSRVGLEPDRGRRAGITVTAGVCAIGVVAAISVASDSSFQRPDWPGVVRALGEVPSAGQSRAILIQRYQTLLPLSLDLPDLHRLRRPVRVSQLDVIAMHSPRQSLCWWGAECNLISSQVQPRYRIPGLQIVGRRHVRQFEILELHARRPILLTPAAVSHSLATTDLSQDILMVQGRS